MDYLILLTILLGIGLINKRLNKIIMNQAEFDVKIKEANAAIGVLTQSVEDVLAAVEAETAQIEEWIANQPESVDTSALNSVVDNLNAAVASVANLDDAVEGVFTAPEEEEE